MATINVPADQPTLAAAYAVAAHFDIINLAAGTHLVPEATSGSPPVGLGHGVAVNLSITIQGATGTASDVILSSNGTYHTLQLQTSTITIKDLTIINPDATNAGATMWFAIQSDHSANNALLIDNVIIVSNQSGIYLSGSTSIVNRCNLSITNPHPAHNCAMVGAFGGKGTWSNNRYWGHNIKYWGFLNAGVIKSCSFILSPTTTQPVFSATAMNNEVYNCSIETDATVGSGVALRTDGTGKAHSHVSMNCPNLSLDYYVGTVAAPSDISTAMAQASGQDLMVDAATGDAHVNPLGLSYQNGDYAKIVDPDLDGNNYNSPPSRGCYEETPAAGGGGGGSAVSNSRAGFLPSPFTLTP